VAFEDEAGLEGELDAGEGAGAREGEGALARGPRADTPPAPTRVAAAGEGGGGAPAGSRRRRRRVLAVSAGAAHASLLTDDGRLWMVGARGRGAQLDFSSGPGEDPTAPHPPEGTAQIAPLPVLPGPLAGAAVVALRSSLHHSYALTAEGHLFRWGWRGRVQRFLGAGAPWPPERGALVEGTLGGEGGLAFAECAFGFAHAACLLPTGN